MAGQLLDLVCGPASPLPETYQRYRLVAHLGSGGQAEVYRAVRLCGGVTSAPMTVKVFRVDPRRPLVDELRSWDKGDAALMDLNNRGVTGICRRADGFYGPPPHPPGKRAAPGDNVPYQVYDYLHGVNLREYVTQRSGLAAGARRLNAMAALRTLAGVLRALHHPDQTGATPVLHMDVKPSNVMVLTNGQVRLIDFTGARYWRPEEITQIAYTPEAGGPEAFGGVSQVTPAYDVHGFGAVAYFLVTGAYPRVDSSQSAAGGRGAPQVPPPPWSVLRRHPMLENLPKLRDHLHLPVADRPADRPSTKDLPAWVDRLADLVRRGGVPDVGVDWQEPVAADSPRIVARAPVTGTETDAYQRIERLERELVALRAAVAAPAGGAVAGGGAVAAQAGAGVAGASPGGPPAAGSRAATGAYAGSGGQAGDTRLATAVAPMPALPKTRVAGTADNAGGSGSVAGSGGAAGAGGVAGAAGAGGASGGPGAPGSGSSSGAGGSSGGGGTSGGATPGGGAPGGGASGGGSPVQIRGRASVPAPKPVDPSSVIIDPTAVGLPRYRPPARETVAVLKRGWELSGTGAVFAFICWGIWAASNRGHLAVPALAFVVVLIVAVGVFVMCRLLGRLILVQRLGRSRRTATWSHAITGAFLVAAGVAYLRETPWIIDLINWLRGLD
jgi:hypothetical protein